MFQKSTDAGRTWLPADVLVRRGSGWAMHPDITTDSDGNIYVVYNEIHTASDRHVSCVRSSNGGSTWTTPVRVSGDSGAHGIGWARVAADSAGNLLAAWNAGPDDGLHIFSSVSTDNGATWSPSVRVCRDTVYPQSCYHADVFVQPGTNHYLVAAKAPTGAYLYRSTDMGQTFQPGARLDTSSDGYAEQPHVVADRDHIICDYKGPGVEARTLYTQPDTWGAPHFVGPSYANGAKLAISADGRVHTALMVDDHGDGNYLTYYAYSSDHGVSWSDRELVGDDTTSNEWFQDIAADSTGHAYIVWQDDPAGRAEIWFSTNHPVGIADQPSQQPLGVQPLATVIRNVLVLGAVGSRQNVEYRAVLLDISGRKVSDLKTGANDVSRLSPGVYFVRCEPSAVSRQPSAVAKVVIAR
jgi:hypothetical protein